MNAELQTLPNEPTPDAVFDAHPPPDVCGNCGAPLLGAFCYTCGQPEKSMVRSLHEVSSDIADIIFNIDSRIFRSLWDLYLRPGFLTTEYFAGRRARYVTPFRLFFFLCVIAFFAVQSSLNVSQFDNAIQFDGNGEDIGAAKTAEQVEQRKQAALVGMQVAKNAPGIPESARAEIERAAKKVEEKADRRIKELKADAAKQGQKTDTPKTDTPRAEASSKSDITLFDIDGHPFDEKTNPVKIDWLPDGMNARLNATIEHIRSNIKQAQHEPSRVIAGMFSVAPQTLFVLMPLFAVLLKIVYIFKRRLYMEHLMVALHSHAFIFQSLLLLALLSMLRDAIATSTPALAAATGYAIVAAWIWLPLYLVIMQKRVYRQGWFLTVFKYCFIGLCYTVMLSLGLAVAIVVGLAIA